MAYNLLLPSFLDYLLGKIKLSRVVRAFRRWPVYLFASFVIAFVSACGGGGGGSSSSPPLGGGGGTAVAPSSTASEAPSITAQPEDTLAEAGSSALFTVAASSTEPLAFQWFRNGDPIDGATSDSYETPAATDDNEGDQYAVQVTNSVGSVVSRIAKLSVTEVGSTTAAQPEVPSDVLGSSATGSAATSNKNAQTMNAGAPKITVQPVNQTVKFGGAPAVFRVTASGSGKLQYQWQSESGINPKGLVDGKRYWYNTGSNQDTLLVDVKAIAYQNQKYRVVVRNAAGSITSQVATLNVTVPLAIWREPSDRITGVGVVAHFQVRLDPRYFGQGEKYQWRHRKPGGEWKDIPGANRWWYDVPNPLPSSNGDQYSAVITTSSGSKLISRSATLTVVGCSSGATFDAKCYLSFLPAADGFKISGRPSEGAGHVVSNAGDVNGDGTDDFILLVQRFGSGPLVSRVDAAFVIFGKKGVGFPKDVNLATLSATDGFRIGGAVQGDNAVTSSVSAAGDINGDGIADLIVSAWRAKSNGVASGAAYVIFGKKGGFGTDIQPSSLNGTNGFRISGAAANDMAGSSISAAGDINGDGIGDLVVGAPGAAANGSRSGAAYVIFGKKGGFGANINVLELNGNNGFRINGAAAEDRLGASVSAAGDLNGDGIGDLIVGAPGLGLANRPGAAYVILGKKGGFGANINVLELNGSNGFRINGAAADGSFGYSVSAAGDINGDGIGDLIVGTPGGRVAYVMFGKKGGFGPNVNVLELNGNNGFRINGAAADGSFGYSVSAAGDINGDGIGDLIVGAPNSAVDGSQPSGAAYVIFGKKGGFTPNLNASTLSGPDGFVIFLSGTQGGMGVGASVSAAGDVNGDGIGDIIVGSWHNAAYVIYGQKKP